MCLSMHTPYLLIRDERARERASERESEPEGGREGGREHESEGGRERPEPVGRRRRADDTYSGNLELRLT